jgi:4-aminobutyrate aminotransferase-like enzyme
MRIIKSCLENGIISDWFLFCTTAMRIAPPLTISDQELIEALQKIKMILDTT